MPSPNTSCPVCDNEIPFHSRNCPVCQSDVGFPNVRQALREQQELDHRYGEALTLASIRGTEEALKAFERALLSSRAVMCRSTTDILAMLRSDCALWGSFYQQVGQSARLAQYNQWDMSRKSVDEAMFPLYAEEVIFAALSLNDRGPRHYGDCHLVLKSDLIESRATVFEENPFTFFQRHRVVIGTDVPTGYRGCWSQRQKVCVAKLHTRIAGDASPEQFARILLWDDAADSDFVEVHVYGAIHRRALEKISFEQCLPAPQQVILEGITRELERLGIQVARVS